ncbi:MAG TPA: TatD family hydrolase [bacterium]|nr:TatD family hydrolase [bacterium]
MFIDIHVHTRKIPGFPRAGKPAYATPEQLIERYEKINVERAAILPGVNPECSYSIQSNEEVLEICGRYPDRFIPFCNIDPRQITNSPQAPLDEIMQFYKDKGCKGIGEVCCNLEFSDPLVQNLFKNAEKIGFPITFHIAGEIGGTYGLYDDPGLPQLEVCLQRFPQLVFLGHSQAFWSEISSDVTPEIRTTYPKGPVKPGRVVEMMRKYSNLHGDLSAHSGYNAISRDESFGVEFLVEFQDRLHFGTDICAPDTQTPIVDFLLNLLKNKKIDSTVFDKIARKNTEKLFGLSI